MARPATKPDLLEAADGQFEKMWKLFDAMPAEQQKAPFDFGDAYVGKEAHWERDKNMRDVFIHLYEWHQLLLNWVEANQGGDSRPFIPAPYNWKTYGQMNIAFCERHRNTLFNDAVGMVKESHGQVIKMIDSLSDEELFSKGYLSWTGASTLGSYCVSATASHYDWAMKKMKAHNRTYGG